MSKIEWTDEVWNSIRGCSRVSAGCERCYAERMAHRFSGPGQSYEGLTVVGKHGPRWTGEVRLVPEALGKPLRWRKPRRVFVNSMSDLFHEDVPFTYIAAIFGVMAASPRHIYQILTKRPERMREFFEWVEDRVSDTTYLGMAEFCEQLAYDATSHLCYVDRALTDAWPLPNVWLGVSVEDQATADERIPTLLHCPAAVRWVSYEPALGPVDFREWLACRECGGDGECEWVTRQGEIRFGACQRCMGGGDWISWLVVGGESGPGARPFDLAWARSTIEQCRDAAVPCFVKQLGASVWITTGSQADASAFGGSIADRKGGDMAEWPADLRVREMPGRGTLDPCR